MKPFYKIKALDFIEFKRIIIYNKGYKRIYKNYIYNKKFFGVKMLPLRNYGDDLNETLQAYSGYFEEGFGLSLILVFLKGAELDKLCISQK